MSNPHLIVRIADALQACRHGSLPPAALADTLRGNVRALEALPYAALRTAEDIALDLDIADALQIDGFASELDLALARLQDWLRAHG